ncbi:MAG: HlyD family efflux transporter periplasmic adaptor subunit [Candidatus Gracilibacteria bacterium]|nr:HlyD family efflux transporter periplasmic adaptor subunit [Candidatus Gracilibacteria bacterium]
MKTNILSLFLISTLLLASCSEKPQQEKKFYETAVVTTGSISGTDRVIATVEGKTTADLSFKASGRIASVLVKPGDSVKKGQILATLGNEEGSITSAGLSSVLGDISGIRGSVGSLYDARIDNMANDAEKAKIGVELAQKDLDLAKQTLKNSIAIFSGSILSSGEKVTQAEKNLDYANNNLTNSTKLLGIQGESLRKNALNSMSNAFIIARNARDFADETLGVTDANKAKNDDYEVYLGAKNSLTKTEAENSFQTFNTEYEAMYVWYYANIIGKTDVSKETLNEGLSRSLTILEHLRDMLHAISTVLENSITSSTFPESDLNVLKNKTTAFLSSLELSILDQNGNGVKGSIAAIEAFDSSYSLKIQQLQDAVQLAEEDLNLAKTGKDTSSSDVQKNMDTLAASVHMKEDALKLAQVAVSEVEKNRNVLSSERDSKLREIDSNLSETRMNRNLANNTIESGIIRAPFDGVVLTRNFDIGSMVSPNLPVFSLTSTDGFLVKTNVDLTKTPLVMGQKVSLSRLSDGASFETKVAVLRTEPDMTHNKGYTELVLTGTGIRVGDRVEVLFEKKNISEVHTDMVIPSMAIITKYGETGVYILENGYSKYQIITVLASDGDMTAVTGLSLGQAVITKGNGNILDGEQLE